MIQSDWRRHRTSEFRWPRGLHATFAGPRQLRKTLPAAHLQRIVGWPVDATTQLDFLPLASTTQASMRGACLRFVKENYDATQRLSSGGRGGFTQPSPDHAS